MLSSRIRIVSTIALTLTNLACLNSQLLKKANASPIAIDTTPSITN